MIETAKRGLEVALGALSREDIRQTQSYAMKKNAILTMFLLLLNFALWGLVNNMSDNLVPARRNHISRR